MLLEADAWDMSVARFGLRGHGRTDLGCNIKKDNFLCH